MNDLEICTCIAEIESKDYFITDGIISAQNDLGMCREYNPLTDDALCFHLMDKYSITFHKSEQEQPNDTFYSCCSTRKHNSKHTTYSYESANKAICLAIIEAHKGE
jgi:hypothetical protein